ncbi:MAG TPA: zinc metallopeptidase [Phycisphaerae bacterium]|nr:zinc metallopeptidase [Phycisphaerae bacterium]HRW51700.1 zinc metallopeptidase [Phycisphaerae bacterium]
MLSYIYMFDPMYFLFLAPGMLLAMWAQYRVKSAYAEGAQIQASSGMTGAQAAQRILDIFGITNVRIESINSFLGDHYDARKKVLRLSPDVFNGRSIAALGIAAHEVGHAIQDAKNYSPLVIRNGLVPLASTGSSLSFILIMMGLFIQGFQWLAIAGVALFGTVVLFQLVNLPVEFNASSRARAILVDHGLISPMEDRAVAKVLNAAAMTYVAATLTALMQFLYFALRVLGDRR